MALAELPRLNGIIKALEEGSVAFVGSAPADGTAGTSAPYDGALFEQDSYRASPPMGVKPHGRLSLHICEDL